MQLQKSQSNYQDVINGASSYEGSNYQTPSNVSLISFGLGDHDDYETYSLKVPHQS